MKRIKLTWDVNMNHEQHHQQHHEVHHHWGDLGCALAIPSEAENIFPCLKSGRHLHLSFTNMYLESEATFGSKSITYEQSSGRPFHVQINWGLWGWWLPNLVDDVSMTCVTAPPLLLVASIIKMFLDEQLKLHVLMVTYSQLERKHQYQRRSKGGCRWLVLPMPHEKPQWNMTVSWPDMAEWGLQSTWNLVGMCPRSFSLHLPGHPVGMMI